MNSVARVLGPFPTLYRAAYLLTGAPRNYLVGRNTEIVIEGFPRCANTFAVLAFKFAQQRDVVVASHVHSPSQIIQAARRGIPAILLIRDPVDASVSLVIRHPYLSLRQALVGYVAFYRQAARYRDHYLSARFEDVTNDFGPVTERFNRKFGTDFAAFDHTPENVEACFGRMQWSSKSDSGDAAIAERAVSRPSEKRSALAESLRRDAESEHFRELVAEARNVYQSALSEDA